MGTGDKRPDMGVDIIQLNAGRRPVVASSLRDHMRDLRHKPMILLIQEPFSNKIKNTVMYGHVLTNKEKEAIAKEKTIRKQITANKKKKKMTSKSGTGESNGALKTADLEGVTGVRAKIYVDENLNEESECHMLSQFTSPDQVAISLLITLPNGVKQRIVLCSAYLPGDINEENMIKTKLEGLVEYCLQNKIELLIGCDANAHCTDWFSDHTDARGERLATFCIEKGLQLINDGKGIPTFKAREGARASKGTIIDITLATPGLAEMICKWEVSNKEFDSDHNAIEISIEARAPEQLEKRSRRSTDWRIFHKNVRRLAGSTKRKYGTGRIGEGSH